MPKYPTWHYLRCKLFAFKHGHVTWRFFDWQCTRTHDPFVRKLCAVLRIVAIRVHTFMNMSYIYHHQWARSLLLKLWLIQATTDWNVQAHVHPLSLSLSHLSCRSFNSVHIGCINFCHVLSFARLYLHVVSCSYVLSTASTSTYYIAWKVW